MLQSRLLSLWAKMYEACKYFGVRAAYGLSAQVQLL